MRELSLHIMDIVENGITAGADRIGIDIIADSSQNFLIFKVTDNGSGIPGHMKESVTNPFTTNRTTRKVGLGLSLLKEAALRCDGHFEIISKEQKGTRVKVLFKLDHIDRAPMGNIAISLITLIIGNPTTHFIFNYKSDNDTFLFNTEEIKKELGGLSLSNPVVSSHLKDLITNEISGFALKI